MKIRAAVLEEFGQPLVVQDVDLAGPREGEVLVRLAACGVCHTDMYSASGVDPSGYRPCVLGHEAPASSRRSAEGVTSVAKGDHVVTLFSPQCGNCVNCRSGKTNICLAIREQQGKGYLPDGTTRLKRDGEEQRHFMAARRSPEATVMPEIALAKVTPEAPLEAACLFACGLSTGLGAAMYRAQVQEGSTVVVFGSAWSASAPSRGARLQGRRADHRRRPVRGAPGARPPPRAPRTRGGRRGRRRARARGDRRLRRGLHLRGDRPRRRHAPGRRGRPHGVGRVLRDRRRRQGGDPRHRPALPHHRAHGRGRVVRRASRAATRSRSSSSATWPATSTSTRSSRTASASTTSTAAST
jgi:hypothetical protein